MKKTLYLLFLLGFHFQSIYSVDPEAKIKTGARVFETQLIFDKQTSEKANPPGWNLHNGFPETKNSSNEYLNRNTTSLVNVGFFYTKKTNDLKVILDLDILRRGERAKESVYLGRNTFVSSLLGEWWVGVGRREFMFRKSAFRGYADGGDGVFLERQFSDQLMIQIFVLDHYQGYRLLEKEYLYPGLLNDKETEIKSGQRRRHSFGLLYEGQYQFTFGVSYLEFGAWGGQAKEIPSYASKYGADGDSLLMGNFGMRFNASGFHSSFEVLWAKGVDKSYDKSLTTQGSIPIEGEALSFGVGWKNNEVYIDFAGHVNDSDERTKENKITKLGYQNTGTHLGSTYFLSQYLQLFPSGHFTDSGLERSQTLLSGRTPASYGELTAGVYFFSTEIKLISAYFLPFLASGASDGQMSFKRERYERFFLAESGLEVSYHSHAAQIGAMLSYLTSSADLALRGTILSCFARANF